MEPSVETIARFQQRDRDAFEHLYRRESPRLAKFIRRYVRSVDLAEDIFQESWIRAWHKRAQLRRPDRFVSWFYQIVRNCIYEQMRKRNQTIQITAFGEMFDAEATERWMSDQPDPKPGPREQAAVGQRMALVEGEIRKLDPSAQEMLALRFGAGLGLREIGEVLQTPLGTVCAKISRSLKTVQANLSRRGIDGA